MRLRSLYPLCALVMILGVAFALYRPMVESNTRYFRHEDDGHHFNRTVEMAKSGDLNPHYFKKPSLHFYLRIPVVLASVEWIKRLGELKSIKEVRTRDPYGLAKYAYTASHPTVLRWSRFGSVASALILIALTFGLAYQLSASTATSAFAACVTAASTEVLRNSHIIGVDMLMAVLCVACTALGVWAYRSFSIKKLALCALVAGLAGSAKYNAAPVALVPLVVWCLRGQSRLSILVPLLVPLVGLTLGSPYILVSLSEFWNDLSFELWHYGVAGHEGNSAPRGIPQATFYARWLTSEGVGIIPALLAVPGVVALFKRTDRSAFVMLAFPFAYAALMILQKANFTRNMIAVVPYIAILAALGLETILSRIHERTVRNVAFGALVFVSLAQIAYQSINTVAEATQHHDSRDTLATWLDDAHLRSYEVAVAGPLQIPFHLFSLPGVDSFNPEDTSIAALAQRGYDYIVAPDNISFSGQLRETLPIESTISGETASQRVPDSPAITIFRIPSDKVSELSLRAPAHLSLLAQGDRVVPSCASTQEQYCWLSNRITALELPLNTHGPRTLALEAMSPWDDQTLTLTTSKGDTIKALHMPKAGNWLAFEAVIPPDTEPGDLPLVLSVTRISSPASRGGSSDTRRLGVAIRAVGRPGK